MAEYLLRPFLDVVLSAFPCAANEIARSAEEELSGWVDQNYRTHATRVQLDGRFIAVPYRIHFINFGGGGFDPVSTAATCLLSRSTDGYLRQRAVRRILQSHESWTVPYVVLPLGEYVLEIGEDVLRVLPHVERQAYLKFVLENPKLMQLLRSRAVSYWDCYYRNKYPKKQDYPPLMALRELEVWAT